MSKPPKNMSLHNALCNVSVSMPDESRVIENRIRELEEKIERVVELCERIIGGESLKDIIKASKES